MKLVKLYLLFLLLYITSAVCAQKLQVSLVDPLVKVFPHSVLPRETYASIDVARGETAAVQLVIRSNTRFEDIPVKINFRGSGKLKAKVGYVDYVYASRAYTEAAVDRLLSPDGWYPDPIIDDKPIVISPDQTKVLYVSFEVPENTPPGEYVADIYLGRGPYLVKKQFVVVRDVTLPPQTLWVTNWYSLNAQRLALMNGGAPVSLYSKRYWLLVKQLAVKMAQYKQNVVLISPLELCQYRMEHGALVFDFTHFDKTVEIFIKAGALKRIEGGHIGGRSGNWTSDFVVNVPQVSAITQGFDKRPISDTGAQAFYSRFLPALRSHLVEKGWWDMYYQHLADEPIQENKESYINIAKFVKAMLPDIKIMEACHSSELSEAIKLWVPQLDFLSKDYGFYKDRLRKGEEVWFYTCLSPRGNYANRFIDLPLIKTRLLHWINFKYDINGYLHWGLNFWNENPFDEVTGINLEGGNILPAGDAWIVYPGYCKLYGSIRLEAMRDGINDFSLLSLLKRRNSALAEEIVNKMVFRFDWYDTSISNFRLIRKKILEGLEN